VRPPAIAEPTPIAEVAVTLMSAALNVRRSIGIPFLLRI
jgi:hypothetical protein